MRIPIRFPSDAEVISEEVRRFRTRSDQDRILHIRGLLAAGALIMQNSPRAAFLREYTLAQEAQARQRIKEFIARHGG
jgi:hypothetical protein